MTNMTEEDELETIDVPREAFLHMAYEIVMERGDHDVLIPGEGTTDDFYDNISPRDVDSVEIMDDQTVHIEAETAVRELIDKKPATRLQPPERITRKVEVWYEIDLTMDGTGHGRLYAEGL